MIKSFEKVPREEVKQYPVEKKLNKTLISVGHQSFAGLKIYTYFTKREESQEIFSHIENVPLKEHIYF